MFAERGGGKTAKDNITYLSSMVFFKFFLPVELAIYVLVDRLDE
jgi:hypothetical protein